MQLWNVPRGSLVKVLPANEDLVPPDHREFQSYEELTFIKLDGMYSYCIDDAGNIVHLAASAEVEILREGPQSPNTESRIHECLDS